MIEDNVRAFQNSTRKDIDRRHVSSDLGDLTDDSAAFSSFFGWFLAGDFGWFPPAAAPNETDVRRTPVRRLLAKMKALFQLLWLKEGAQVKHWWHDTCKESELGPNQGGTMITTTVRDLSISVRSKESYEVALSALREALRRGSFEILCEFPVAREVERKVGLRWRQLGLHWQQRYTVFVVWSPSDAYQALLSDRDGGLLIPFNISIAEDGDSAVVAVTNHNGPLAAKSSSIGVQVLVRDLTRKLRQVLVEVATAAEPLDQCGMQR